MRFDYLEPQTLKDALSLMRQYNGKAKVIAGGTDVMVLARNKNIKPEYLIDITNIPGLEYIKFDDKKGLVIGALTTIRALEKSPEIQERYPIISTAAGKLGTVAIRNVGTIGGNLCNALSSAETAQVMLALGAMLSITGPKGKREVAIGDFFTGASQTAGAGQTVLKSDEILTEIKVPKMLPNTYGLYIKHSPRGTADLATVNITVLLTMDADKTTCKEASIVLGAVAPTPLKAKKAESVLRGKKLDEDIIEKAAQVASDEAHPRADKLGSIEYKKEMVRVLVARAIRQIAAG